MYFGLLQPLFDFMKIWVMFLHFLDSATADPEPCPSGRFGPGTGLESEDDCSFCTEGFYCPNLAQTNATLPCDAGMAN